MIARLVTLLMVFLASYADAKVKFEFSIVDGEGRPASGVSVFSSARLPSGWQGELVEEHFECDGQLVRSLDNPVFWELELTKWEYETVTIKFDFRAPSSDFVKEGGDWVCRKRIVMKRVPQGLPNIRRFSFELDSTEQATDVLRFEEVDGKLIIREETVTSASLPNGLASGITRLYLSLERDESATVKIKQNGPIRIVMSPRNVTAVLRCVGGTAEDGLITSGVVQITPADPVFRLPAAMTSAPLNGYTRSFSVLPSVYSSSVQNFYFRVGGFYGKGAMTISIVYAGDIEDVEARIEGGAMVAARDAAFGGTIVSLRLAINQEKGNPDARLHPDLE